MTIHLHSRRTFFKVAGLAAVAPVLAAAPLAPPLTAPEKGADALRPFRLMGTLDGLILESRDGGQTWRRVANLGKECVIEALTEQSERFQAVVKFGEHRFTLHSTDGRVWRTQPVRKA